MTMIKNILIIILLAIGVSCYSQTQTSRVVVSMVDGGDNIVFTHKDSSKTIVPDHSVGVIYRVANSIAINVTVKSEGETDRIIALDYRYILSPTFASTKSLIDTISAWTSSANSSSSSYVDTAITRRIDTTNAILSRGDTSNSGLLLSIHNLLVDSLDKNIFIENDSIRVWFNNPLDTSNAGILNAIYNQLVDSLDKQLYVLNPYIDSAIVRRMDTIIDRLTTTEKLDTLKGLVYTASAKVRTNRDTLFNCKSISFGRKSTASGTLILTFENGESESFDVANDDLPAWVNGEFISYLDYNATGAVGLIVNTLGCSQTDTEICAKVKPIFDCELVVPITCNGWQSASGVWQTLSGCWNTGQ